ncbi:MAG: TRAP transporter small permease [Gammaproteobacteria bacterium]|nr:TRAP transporter small permease [Gammaproteobacteria bacterium]MBU1440731.1 TRAP transporter small permease [Gammaproteobacteria bacterium]MBU2409832.1 TRAP transporter small permease [Gammaproteobacteria bacterium]
MSGEGAARPPAWDYFEEVVSGAALVVVIASTCWGVVTRYITEQPAAWTGEVAGIAFAWLVFVGTAAGFKYGMHVTIDMLVAFLPRTLRRLLMAAADLLVLAFLVTLLVLAVEFSIDAWGDPTSVLRLPRTVTYSSVVVGALCMLLRYGRAAWRRWNGLAGAWLAVPGEAGAEL